MSSNPPAEGAPLPPAAERILQDLADYGWKASIPGMICPIEFIDDELEGALAASERFELVREELDGAMHRIVLAWKGKGTISDLAADFLAVLSCIVHSTAFIDRRIRADGVTYSVVTGRPADRKDPDTHILQFKLVGPGVDELVTWTQANWPDHLDKRP